MEFILSICRVVYISSFVSIFDVNVVYSFGKVYIVSDWNFLIYEDGVNVRIVVDVYCVSKVVVERIVWDFMRMYGFLFDLVSLCLVMIFGIFLFYCVFKSISEFNMSNVFVWRVIKGGENGIVLLIKGLVWVDV